MAIPFTLLREVNIQVALPSWKLNAINNLGYGTNAKLMIGFNNRPWNVNGHAGYAFTDQSFQNGWENSLLQGGTSGGYTMFFGGNTGVASGTGSPASQAAIHMPGFELVYPGATAHMNGNIQRMHWPTHPWSKASYACYRPGQFTTVSGAEKKAVGNMVFAGEHCSWNFQGYMNGGAETGRKAAEKVIELATVHA
jgi:monoamine oxidase